MGSGIIIMRDSNGDELPLSADLVLSKETPDGQTLFSILSPEQLAGTEGMDREAREAYKASMAEESSTKGHSHEAKKLREKIGAEIMEEVEELLGEVTKSQQPRYTTSPACLSGMARRTDKSTSLSHSCASRERRRGLP